VAGALHFRRYRSGWAKNDLVVVGLGKKGADALEGIAAVGRFGMGGGKSFTIMLSYLRYAASLVAAAYCKYASLLGICMP
jgi:hypothetical protein